MRPLLLNWVAVSSTGDLASRVVNVADGAQHLAAELVDLGVVSPGRADEDGRRLRLIDVRLVEAWPLLSIWVHQARPALIARSALEQDSHRWATASRPRAWLYDYVRLTLTADALIALAPATDDPAATPGTGFRFGAATTAHIPPGTVTEFWTGSQAASLHTLRVHQMIAAVFIALIVMILGLGVALGAVTA